MTRLFFFPALLALLLLFGCNEDRVFMTPSEEVDVVDVTDKDIFFNGELVGNVEKDIVENEEKNQYKIYLLKNNDNSNIENMQKQYADFLNEMSGKYSTVNVVLVPSKSGVMINKLPDNAKVYSTDYVPQKLKSQLNDDVGFLY